MLGQLRRIGTPGPKIIGIDEVSIRKGHHLPDRGVGPDPGAVHLVRRNGPLRSLHGCLLQVAWTQEEQGDQDRGHGYVKAVP